MCRPPCNSKAIIGAKSMVCSDRKRAPRLQITNAPTGWQKQPQSINQRCNHWEWHNETAITKEPPRKNDFNGGFLRTEKIWLRRYSAGDSDIVWRRVRVAFGHLRFASG